MGINKPQRLSPYRWQFKEGVVTMRVSAALFPDEPLYVSCCVFMDDYYVWLDLSPDGKTYVIELTAQKNPLKPSDAEKLARSFHHELINNVVRYKIAKRNHHIREWIIREALLFSQPRKEQKRIIKELVDKGCVR